MNFLNFLIQKNILKSFRSEFGPEHVTPAHHHDATEGCEYLEETVHMYEEDFDATEFGEY